MFHSSPLIAAKLSQIAQKEEKNMINTLLNSDNG